MSADPQVPAPGTFLPAHSPRADVGVIGGSGFYSLLDDATEVTVGTPWGAPSDPLMVGTIASRSVAFLPRHGRDHRLPPHGINYRANLWALRAIGVRQVIAPCAVGSLRPDVGPGAVVIPDQLVDRTTARVQTFYDDGAVHVSFADPYCRDGRSVVISAAEAAHWHLAPAGTMVIVEGPRFTTRAESHWYAAQGWSVVNMTGYPEAVLARELAMCYTAIALVTDYDAGASNAEAVSQAEVFRVFGENVGRLRELVLDVAGKLPRDRACECARALDGLQTALQLP